MSTANSVLNFPSAMFYVKLPAGSAIHGFPPKGTKSHSWITRSTLTTTELSRSSILRDTSGLSLQDGEVSKGWHGWRMEPRSGFRAPKPESNVEFMLWIYG